MNDDKVMVDIFRRDCNLAVQAAKDKYLSDLGGKLTNPNTTRNSYWKIINKLLNKHKTPKISPLLINNKLIVNCKEK